MSDLPSRNENILYSIIHSEPYLEQPYSREEALLLELKDVIEAGGGGGGGTTNYNLLSNKPKINGVELKGDLDPETDLDLGAPLTTAQRDALLALI